VAKQIISHYEVLQKLGEGGMGVVSLARDTRLGRQVALKLLRPEALQHPESKQRFIQEARTASSLNHPNIVTIYDIDAADGIDFIAMEYVPGQPLGELIPSHGLGTRLSLQYAIQIARALEAAHAAGIIHRDLKPGNVMVSKSGTVKVVDFGLAKLLEPSGGAESTQSPRTASGLILGTVAYMSPEQAGGRGVDARSDIFSFGAVLYEMLSGRRAFAGASSAHTMAALLRDEPAPLAESVGNVPRELERVVTRCLRKDAGRRYQDMADLRITLEDIEADLDSIMKEPPVAAARTGGGSLQWVVPLFVVFILAGVGFAWWKYLRPSPGGSLKLTRVSSNPGLTMFPAISPDGSLLAYASDRAGAGNLDIWVQQAAGGEPIRLTQDEMDEYEPVFSPDGSRIAYRSEKAGGGIYLTSSLGGEPRPIARDGRSPAFSPDGTQLAYTVGSPGVGATFSFGASSLHIVPVTGGEPRQPRKDFPVAHHPVWTEDGRHVMFLGSKELGPPNFDWWVSPVDGGEATNTGALEGLRKQGFTIGPHPFAAWGDWVIFSAGRGDSVNLFRIRLSRENWKVTGQPEQLTFGTGREIQPSMARNGRLVFASSSGNADIWAVPVDANEGQVTGEPRQLTRDATDDYYPRLSPNGKQVVFISARSGSDDVWLLDLATGRQTPLQSTAAREMYPKVAADGTRVFFGSIDENRLGIFMMTLGAGVTSRLCENCGLLRDMTADGSWLLLQQGPPPRVSLMQVARKSIQPLLADPKYPVYAPKLSPDEKWVAFQGVERPTTRTLYVAPFRAGQRITRGEWIGVTDGSAMDRNPYWSPDGNLLYFLSERDGFRCIWALKLDGETRRPTGKPFAVSHFHNATQSLMNLEGPGQVSLSIGNELMVFSMGHLTGNVWMTQLTGTAQ